MSGHPLVLDDELRADALGVLRDVQRWTLPERRWVSVLDAMAAMRAAADNGDVQAFRAAVYALELAGPVRAVGADEKSAVSATDTVREEVGRLSVAIEEAAEAEKR